MLLSIIVVSVVKNNKAFFKHEIIMIKSSLIKNFQSYKRDPVSRRGGTSIIYLALSSLAGSISLPAPVYASII